MKANIKPIQRFYEALKTPSSKLNYPSWLNQFFEYGHADGDGLLDLKDDDIQDLIFNYIVHLKNKVDKGYYLTDNKTGKKTFRKLSPNSIRPMIAPIKLFCDMNNCLINWKYLMKILPKQKPAKNQGPWMNEEIQKMLGATTNLRNKAIIHFLASTGCRIGALHDLTIADLKKIEDGAIVWLYDEDLERYRTCLTPEAYRALMDYFGFRAEKGYPATKEDDPIFTQRDYKTPITYEGSREILAKIQKTAGLRGHKAENKISSKAPNHAFRKRYETILVNSGLHVKYVNYLMGHKDGQDRSYFKPTDEELWKNFKNAIPELMINQEEKLRFKNKNLQLQNEEYENVLKKKLEEIEEKYRKDFDFMSIQNIINHTKMWAMSEINFKAGNNVLDKKHRQFMEELNEIDDISELQKIIEKYGLTVSWSKKEGWKISKLEIL